MISTQDRSYYFGASDTNIIVGNWNTKTFEKWWLVKLGIARNTFTNESMKAGTNYEHKILDSLNLKNMQKDKQIIKGRLRVNLDGNTKTTIYEVKTYRHKNGFNLSKNYYNQVQVEMYGSGYRRAYIVAYGLKDKDYKNYFNTIDKNRLSKFKIEYNKKFIEEVYLPKLKYLTECIEKGKYPTRS